MRTPTLMILRRPRATAGALLVVLSTTIASSQQVSPALFSGLKWRLIGPFRGGRVSAGAIDPDVNTYYIGTPGGGVWKTTDAGQVWVPIFDQVRVASIGAIAVSRANSMIVYVGTGEQTPGNGIYKSTDGGVTWANVGLTDTHIIGEILVDPADPDLVLVAAIGDRGSGAERGVFRSADGGRTWKKVLYKEDGGGSASLVAAPDNPEVLYAAIAASADGDCGGGGGRGGVLLYKSLDKGSTWAPVASRGLPTSGACRQAIAIAAGTGGRRLFVNLRDGLYQSDDGGDSWRRSTTDPRIAGIGVIADPKNPDILYVTQTSMYRSMDGGRTFESLVGAPSGDDFRLLWIDPHDSKRLLAGVDQGGIISVDAGRTWSNWYNQPTAQLYHVSTNNAFPYRVYAAQQDSGTVAVPSRSDYGEISDRERYSIGGFEYGFIVADPLDPNIVYSQGWYRTVVRFDKTTGQITHVFVPGTKFRTSNMVPLAFSPHDPHTLYLGAQFVLKTSDGGMHWESISPDLTDRKVTATAANRPPVAPAISTLAPSTVQRGEIWAGTSNGAVHFTDDGMAWPDVTPQDTPALATVNTIEAGRHDAAAAYAAISGLNDSRPYVYRTRDKGRTWQKIVAGLDDSALVRVVREDPVRKGLLYAGTETSVYVSFDDGDHWQSLQLNLPTSSMRDLVVHGDDLVVATYGRSLWILDNVTPLREIAAETAAPDVRLFHSPAAVRVRWDMNQDTPLPIETPAGRNPPDGAIIDYYLKSTPPGEVTLTISDARGDLVRKYTSEPPPRPTLLPNVPDYWFAPPAVLSKAPGMNRFAWNLRYPTPKVLPFSYYGNVLSYVEYTLADHAIPGETPRDQPEGPYVVPGEYVAELSVGGRTYRQTLTVKPDPRVHPSQADLIDQLALVMDMIDGLAASYDAYYQLTALRSAIADRRKSMTANAGGVSKTIEVLDGQAASIMNGTPGAPGVGPANRDLARYFTMAESGDARPAETLRAAAGDSCQALADALGRWRQLNGERLPAVNAALVRSRLEPLPIATAVPALRPCDK